MNFPLLIRTGNNPIRDSTLQAIVRTVAAIAQKTHPDTFVHVQPHAHATARLVRHFAAAHRFHDGIHRLLLEELEFSAYMHDIGKYFIAPSVLLKPGPLDEEEKALMSLHSVYGSIIISKLPGITDTIRKAVLHHHEHWDGTGYPDGLSGSAIPFAARIISIVDVYTSLRARRSYKPMLTKLDAVTTLTGMAGHELDPSLVEDFISLVRHHYRDHVENDHFASYNL